MTSLVLVVSVTGVFVLVRLVVPRVLAHVTPQGSGGRR